MATDDLAEIVSQLRESLHDWNENQAVNDLLVGLRGALAPVNAAAADLSTDAQQKLAQIHAMLDAKSAFTQKERDALDMLLLGLWIRIEQALGTPSARD